MIEENSEFAVGVPKGESDCGKKSESGKEVLRALYSDESAAFRTPCYPMMGERVSVRLRVEKGFGLVPSLVVGTGRSIVRMERVRSDNLFDWYEAQIICGIEPIAYRFVVSGAQRDIVYLRDGGHWADDAAASKRDFRINPGSCVPQWAQGALQYQIFVDRFANGDATNDVVDREYLYDGKPVRKSASWDASLSDDDYRCFYGGDLQGVAAKLDYLQSLGVEVIYLNPIFVSPSSHKYDTQDYGHVDPHFAVICDDIDHPVEEGERSNIHALQYIRRTTSEVNLAASDVLFADLCQEIHRRGMKIILDGVFNHCGSFSAWLDRESIYRQSGSGVPGAYHDLNSPYRSFFRFDGDSTEHYDAWWGFATLPKLNYEESEELCERVLGIAQHWAMPPYSIDGWRLDVAADLGQSEGFNHSFWKHFRDEVKRANPNLVIIAEHYGDASSWLQGDQWDTVMNYDAFMDPLTYFLTGMEKHSDTKNKALYQDGEAFCATMRRTMARFGWGSLLCAMNELSNHDHSRFLTRTNRQIGRITSVGFEAAGKDVDMRVMREAVAIQMTWPGAPTIYYGDEAGLVGWTDPDCRRTYPWGNEDLELIELHRVLARLRNEHPALRSGSFVLFGGGEGWFAFGRFLGEDRLVVVCNNADSAQVVKVRARELGIEDGTEMRVCFQTDGFDRAASKQSRKASPSEPDEDSMIATNSHSSVVGPVKEGRLEVNAPSRSVIVLYA